MLLVMVAAKSTKKEVKTQFQNSVYTSSPILMLYLQLARPEFVPYFQLPNLIYESYVHRVCIKIYCVCVYIYGGDK